MTAGDTAGGSATPAYRRVLIVRYGEISLKGLNKPAFERALLSRIRKALKDDPAYSGIDIQRSDGLIVIEHFERPEEIIIKRIARVFGVASVSPAIAIEDRRLESICGAAVSFMGAALDDLPHGEPVTFKVFGKRSDKTWPLTSPDMASGVGAAILRAFGPRIKVDVHDPEIRLFVHLRRREVFIYDEKIQMIGGLPLGTAGKGMILLSGGIDSPVAAWLMAKRGMSPVAAHFHSYPYTNQRALEKVKELAGILAGYCGRIHMYSINILPAQEAIAASCPEELMTLLVRRVMMRLAERIAKEAGCLMLITGENLGQVASQTAESLVVTDAAVDMPVMRPLIGFDKTEIMDLAKEIGTYEKSIEPYEDCCTVFLPKHPNTKPGIQEILDAEALISGMADIEENLFLSRELYVIDSGVENI